MNVQHCQGANKHGRGDDPKDHASEVELAFLRDVRFLDERHATSMSPLRCRRHPYWPSLINFEQMKAIDGILLVGGDSEHRGTGRSSLAARTG